MIAVDTNILVYAHRPESVWHGAARAAIVQLATGAETWGIPWACLHEFIAVSTNSRIFQSPTSLAGVVGQVEAWMESPGLRMLAESVAHWAELKLVLEQGRMLGARVHDARIAAICREHGVRELWSADRDFTRIADLRVRNPLLARG